MKKMNFKSDFDFKVKLKSCNGNLIGFPLCDWIAKFYTKGAEYYIASYVGDMCTNCEKEEDGIRFFMNNHGLPPGELVMEFIALNPDERFSDEIREISDTIHTDVMLVQNVDVCPDKTDMEIVMPWIKGDAFVYEDFTDEQIAGLQKPLTDYVAEADESERRRIVAEADRVKAESLRKGDWDSMKFYYDQQYDKLNRRSDELEQLSGELYQQLTAAEESEDVRCNNETLREQAESARIKKESDRNDAELKRISAEKQRAESETLRVSSEDARLIAENRRGVVEQERVIAENFRIAAEKTRSENEKARGDNETDRVNAEKTRVTNESDRRSAEYARVTAENNRVAEFATFENTIAGKQDALAVSDEFTLAGASLSLSEKAKRAAFVDMWTQAVGKWGKYDEKNAPDAAHPFYINELWLTYQEAMAVYAAPRIAYPNGVYYSGGDVRTLIYLPNQYSTTNYNLSNALSFGKYEVLQLTRDTESVIMINNLYRTFKQDTKLRKIIGILSVGGCTDFAEVFGECAKLEYVKLKYLKKDISFVSCPLINLESLRYLVDNAANTSPITVTVHPDVMAKLTSTNADHADWAQLAEDASEKGISFAN